MLIQLLNWSENKLHCNWAVLFVLVKYFLKTEYKPKPENGAIWLAGSGATRAMIFACFNANRL